MSAYTPRTNLWLERSRLDGMLLGGVSYGMLFLLTIQGTAALIRRPRHGAQTAHHRWALLGYVWITFVLATIGFAGNARYTEMIWIDLRDAPGGPAALILDELNYRINVVAFSCYYVMEWFMQALLLHRCFVIWGWMKRVVVPMSVLFAAMIGKSMSIVVLAESNGAIFYNINFQLVYLCLQVGLTIIYTILVVGRLFAVRMQMRNTLEKEHLRPYEIAAIMVVESAALYAVFGIIFIVSFAVHSNISNLVFLSISHVQAIVQLLIIIRVARGRGSQYASTTVNSRSATPIVFKSRLSSRDAMSELERTDPLAGDTAGSGSGSEQSKIWTEVR